MPSDEISEPIKTFLFERIHSHEELEVVVLLGREAAQPWTEETIARVLKIDVSLIRDALNALRNRDIVEALAETTTITWRIGQIHNPQSSELVALYDQHRLEIVMLMSANAIERVRTVAMRTFADCFFLGKQRGDG